MAPPGSSPTSLSTSPAPEGGQLIERPSFISADEDYDAADTPFQNEAHSLVRKGKARQIDHDITDTVSEETSHLQEVGSSVAYPPTSDGEAETRRVEETLKRWELAERQKRKAARESISSTTPTSNVSQRASLLWPNRKSRHPPDNGLGVTPFYNPKKHQTSHCET
ncbi:hypothetical protein BD779DRAFT_137593 [Infundibulicybe gibba]|nr:hypothetical protein BD779DRAFT_137593 [Infundibulicybe gibba]